MVAYHIDVDAILAQLVKNSEATILLEAWKIIFNKIHKSRSRSNTWILDDEYSNQLKDEIHNSTVQYQLVPPYFHQVNAVEQAFQTFKVHFKSGLDLLDPNHLVQECDQLLPQAKIIPNLFCSTKVNPRLSAQAFIFEAFNHNKNPLVPPGIKVLAHSKPDI